MSPTKGRGRNRLLGSLPRSRQSLLFLLAFTLFYLEDFNIFSNSGVVQLCFGMADVLPFRPQYFSLFVTFMGFLLLMVLYRWRLFAISEGKGLVACCCFIVSAPLLWLAAPYAPNPLPVALAGLALLTFGHLCFLPEIVKNLADIGVAQSLVSYACVLVVSAVLRPLIEQMPAPALMGYIMVSPVVMLVCLRQVEKGRQRPLELRKDAGLRIPRALFVTMVALGLLAGLRISVVPGGYMDSIVSNTVAMVVAAVCAVYMALFRTMNFNRLIYLIALPIMVGGLVLATYPGGILVAWGGAVYNLGYHVFYAALWALYSYLVRFSSFNYYWLPVTAAVGGFAGRVLGVVSVDAMAGLVPIQDYLPFIVAAVSLLVMMLAVYLCSKNNMKSGWGSIAPGNDDFILDSFERNCAAVAKQAGLTSRESDVLQLLARGRNRQYIAQSLFITEGTAKTHIKHVYRKVGVHSQQELIDVVESARSYSSE